MPTDDDATAATRPDASSASRAPSQRCPAVKRNGSVCGAKAGPSGYCIGHAPRAQEARAKGGAGTSRQARALRALPPRLRPIADKLSAAIEEVHSGTLDPRAASAMASLAGALVRVVTAGDLEERVRQLEELQAEQATPRRGGMAS